MKRSTMFALTGVMTVFLSACGGSNNMPKPTKTSEAPAAAAAAAEENKASEAASPTVPLGDRADNEMMTAPAVADDYQAPAVDENTTTTAPAVDENTTTTTETSPSSEIPSN
jgi:hypothetical protein